MNKSSYGAKRKRTNTPVMNRKRAVESRHFRAPVNKRKSAVRKIETPVSEVAEETIVQIAEEAETESKDQIFFSADTEEKTAEPAAEGSQDILSKITSVFRGLFKKNRKQDAAEAAPDPLDMASEAAQPVGIGGVVSSVASWMTSPIDPDSEENTAERTAEEAQEENGEVPQYEENETDQTDQTEENQKTETGENDIRDGAEEAGEDVADESGGTFEDNIGAEAETEEESETEVDTSAEVPEEAGAETAEETEAVSDEETEAEEPLSQEEPSEETAEAEPGEEAQEDFSPEEIPADENESDESQQQTELIDIPQDENESDESRQQTELIDIPQQVQETSEEEEHELTREEKRAERKALRKETKLQLIDEIVDKPRAGLLTMALLPGYAMKKVSTVEKTTLSAPSVLILNVIKWAAIGTFFAMFIESFVNLFEYSFVRMIFSDVAALAFKFGGFGLLLEYACYIIIGLFCGLIRKRVSTLKLMEIEGRSSLFVGLVFIIADLLIWKGMLVYAVIAAVIGTVCGLMLKGFGMDLVLPISKGTQIILAAILIGIAVWLTFPFVNFAVSGLTDIFKAILNL